MCVNMWSRFTVATSHMSLNAESAGHQSYLYFVLTLDIDWYRRGHDLSILILRLAGVVPSVLRADGGEMIEAFWSLNQCLVLLVPGVISCWVSITATGQSHWTALHYLSRGTHWHRGKSWSIWRRKHEHILHFNFKIADHFQINNKWNTIQEILVTV